MPILVNEYQQRRERVLKELAKTGAVGLVLAGEGAPPLMGFWRPDQHFRYLTGITSEPGAAVLFDPANPDPKKRCTLFLKPLNPELEAWDGYRDTISAGLKRQYGFDTVMRTTGLARFVTLAARQRKKLACLHPFAVYDGPVSADLALFRKVSERVPGCAIEDRSTFIGCQRAIKSATEIGMVQAAVDATAAGYAAALKMLKPGIAERDVQAAMERAWSDAAMDAGGADTRVGPGYNPIIGSGLNSTVLHYNQNVGFAREGEVLLIDAGCEVDGYTADITRTYPVSGKFTARQREIYELVLKAQEAAINAVKPGVWLHEVDEAARAVFRKKGLEDKYIHGIGHQLGLEVHDAPEATQDGPLAPGMIITIEPGLYFPDERIGVRIEDDVLLTKNGCKNLSAAILKTVKDIER
jgi:Xaa-Pro aminopeptidase